ncbi:hypothetical protein BV25DRAFT_1887140 [Artomyces pyxidatus]|uniref:Uncharacterized protein n=1 Tax=Artomyces pyxidatus TaxID=48021 RepID=A0ACB8SXD2_9AGAM|nr:hypothetical protein BV25DRAFT_1887140 [Artomyces pyxidatus]
MPSATAELTAVVSLESPRPVPNKSRTVVLDAGIYNSADPTAEPMYAALRFYNEHNVVLPEDGGLFFVTAKVAKWKKGLESVSDGLSDGDYDILGDIMELIPINGNSDVVDPRQHRATIRCSGTVSSVDPKAASFKLPASQWTMADSSGIFPAKVVIPKESKWKDRAKALPSVGSIVSFSGYLAGAEKDANGAIVNFVVEVSRHLEFLGRTSASPSTPPSGELCTSNAVQGSRSKLRFSLSGSNTLSDLPSTPSPKALGKRPQREESNDDIFASSSASSPTPGPSANKRRRVEKENNDGVVTPQSSEQ